MQQPILQYSARITGESLSSLRAGVRMDSVLLVLTMWSSFGVQQTVLRAIRIICFFKVPVV